MILIVCSVVFSILYLLRMRIKFEYCTKMVYFYFSFIVNYAKPDVLMLRLHYVPGSHGSHDFGHRGRNGLTVTQRRGTGSINVARRGCRDRRDRFLNRQKIYYGSHGGIDILKCAVVERGERNKT